MSFTVSSASSRGVPPSEVEVLEDVKEAAAEEPLTRDKVGDSLVGAPRRGAKIYRTQSIAATPHAIPRKM
jgi:hypothetical protein